MQTPILLLILSLGFHAIAADTYTLGPDSSPQPGVPSGRIQSFAFTSSTVFAGTHRDGWVYVPAQYDASKPAALMVFQDGHQYVNPTGLIRVPVVFDNLIHRGEMPVTIGLFINPGHRGEDAPPPDRGGSRNNRSFEYDSLGDAYARFLIDELIPHVASTFDLNISSDPELRAIGGLSSGAICAFTVAWERPDQFRKVLSHIGSYVNIRGGHAYPSMIRSTDRKPIRVFLQDGSNDLNNPRGDWVTGNLAMASALLFAGYEHQFVFGDGAHTPRHGGAILPESLRWLWKNQAPATRAAQQAADDGAALSKILPANSGWELLAEGLTSADGPCSDADGNFYFTHIPASEIRRIDVHGNSSVWLKREMRFGDMKFGPDGLLYVMMQEMAGGAPIENRNLIAIHPQTKAMIDIATGVSLNGLVVSKAGWVYYTDTGAGQVIAVPISARGMARPRPIAGGINRPNGISLSPDERTLVVSEYGGAHAWTFELSGTGAPISADRTMLLKTLDDRPDSGGDGMATDREGRHYITSHAGIQVFDSGGLWLGMIENPQPRRCVGVAFAGPGREWLYASAGDSIWRRKTLTQGANLGMTRQQTNSTQ